MNRWQGLMAYLDGMINKIKNEIHFMQMHNLKSTTKINNITFVRRTPPKTGTKKK